VEFTPEENNGFAITYSTVTNKNKPFYYGQFYPDEIIMKFSKDNE
jgi:hypothetical protein